MKRISHCYAILLLIGILAVTSAFAKENPWNVALPFESAVIHYEAKGTLQGKETLYIRKGGKEMAKVSILSGKVLFIPMREDTVEITTTDWIIKIDNKKKKAEKFTNPQKFMREEYVKLSPKERKIVLKNLQEMGVNMTSQLGGEIKKAAAKHLGYTCDIINMLGVTVYQMSGTPVALKTEGNVVGVRVNTVATKIDKNVAVPDEVFEIPPGIEVTYLKENDALNRTMAKNMIDRLKDPEAAKKQQSAVADIQKATQSQAHEDHKPPQAEAEESSQTSSSDSPTDEPTAPESKKEKFNKAVGKGIGKLKGLFGR